MYTPRFSIHTHTYWHEKENFLLEQDVYPQWVAFAVESGSFTYRIQDDQGTAREGDWVICPPQTVFYRKTQQKIPLSFHFLSFDIADDPHRPVPSGWLTFKDRTRVLSNLSYLRTLTEETNSYSSKDIEWINHLLKDTMLLYLHENRTTARPKHNHQDPLMAKALRKINTDAFNPIQFSQLAAALELTPVQFTRRFRRAYQINPIDYLQSIRLERAKKLLTETHDTLDQIAEKCGYESGYYLSRLFSRELDMTPSTFRKNYRI